MYAELVASLTVNDRKALAERGVPNARVSEWRTGLRLPTRPQTIALAAVKNVDVMALEAELMAIETQKEAAKKPEPDSTNTTCTPCRASASRCRAVS